MNLARRHSMLATLLLASLPLASMAQQDRDPPDPPHAARMHEHMQQDMQRHLDRLASRLEIRASQQEAWKGFEAAVRGLVPAKPPEAPPRDLDAAARVRQAADRSADRAKRLGQLADATAKLQQVLDPPQKEVLNEVAREFAHRHMHHGMHDGMDGGMPGGMHDGMHGDGPMHEEHGMHRDGMHED